MEGVLLAIAAFTCFVMADTGIKAATPFRLPAYEIVGVVALMEMVILTARARLAGSVRDLWPKHPARALLRACLDLVNNLCVVIALRHLMLALFYILVFLAPAVTTLGEAAFLREPLHWRRWLAVGTGFAGVVVAVNPFAARPAGDKAGFLACMVCVACFSTNMVWSRTIMQNERPQSMTFFSSLLQAAVGLLAMAGHAPSLNLRLAGLLAGVAAVSVLGSLCFFLALRHVSAATVSQYHYTQLLTGALLAYVFFHEKPTALVLAGGVLILISGWLAAEIVRNAPVPPEL